MLKIKSLHATVADKPILNGVTLDVPAGEVHAIMGPNGSGKSTLINVVTGHFRADSGSIVFAGKDIAHWPAHRIARTGIARTYQIPRPFAHLPVRDNVALTAIFGNAAQLTAQARASAQQWLDFAQLGARGEALPGELNLHQTKFLELARALASKPRLLFLDEVLSGLTPTEIDEAVDLIKRIRDTGTTIVFVEHVMRAVMGLSDRIVVLDQGRVIAQGSATDVMARDDVAAAYLGAAHA